MSPQAPPDAGFDRMEFPARRVVRPVRDHAMFLVDPQGHVRSWNEGVGEVLGWDEATWLGQRMEVAFTPEDVAAGVPLRELETADATGRADDNRWMQRRDGARFFAVGSVTPIRDDGTGRAIAFLKVLRDGTPLLRTTDELQVALAGERRQHEQAERQSALLRATLDAIPDALFIGTADGITECNPQGLALLGAASPADLPVPIDELASRLNARRERNSGPLAPHELPFARALRGEVATLRMWATSAGGAQMLIRITAAPIRIGGEIVGVVSIGSDVTTHAQLDEQRDALARTQTLLREREQEFRALVDGVRDYSIYTIDLDGIISSWHIGAELMKGYTATEAIGMPFAMLFTAEDRAAGRPQLEMDIAARSGEFKGEGRRLRKDGEVFEAAVVLTALRGPTGELLGYLKLTQDITQRKRDEAEREDVLRRAETARTDAERANRSKDEFLATISHELRTPLSAILGWGHLLTRGVGADVIAKAAEAINRNARAQVQLIEDLLDTSRIEAGSLKLELQPVDLAAVAERALDAALPAATAQRVALTSSLEPGTHLVMGDFERLQQVMHNLLSNAIKFTPAGGLVTIAAQHRGQSVEFSVSDTGQGMHETFLERAFDRFQQQDASSTRRYSGLGLGLAIVRQIVELHGGTVCADSPGPQQGSTFTVSLPALTRVGGMAGGEPGKDDDALVVASAESHPGSDTRLAGIIVLLVDDDEDGRNVVSVALEDAGATVLAAPGASQAFALWRAHRPHAILCDIGMPGHDGHEFIGWIRERERTPGLHTPAAAFTAFGRAQDRDQSIAAGFDAHWVKPLAPDDLVQAVVDLLRRGA